MRIKDDTFAVTDAVAWCAEEPSVPAILYRELYCELDYKLHCEMTQMSSGCDWSHCTWLVGSRTRRMCKETFVNVYVNQSTPLPHRVPVISHARRCCQHC